MSTILIIGDTDIDGTGAATIIRWYYHSKYLFPQLRPKLKVWFPDRTVMNERFADETWVRNVVRDNDVIYLCDTGPDSGEGNKNLGEILAPKTIYFDHHQSNYDRQEQYIKNYKGFYVREGARCTAKIAFDTFLKEWCRRAIGRLWFTRAVTRSEFDVHYLNHRRYRY